MNSNLKISKTIIKDYNKLVEDISRLNGMIFHSQSIFETYLRANSKRQKKDADLFFLGSRFVYRSPYTGKLITGKSYTVGVKNYKQKVVDIERRLINHFVALAYESFEKFIRSITARIIVYNKRRAIEVSERLGFSSYKSCYLFLQNSYKNNSDIIGLLRSMNDDLDKSFKKEKGLRNFLNFYRVYSKCRNHIIHTTDLITVSILQKHELVDEKFAIRYFGVRKAKGNMYLIDTRISYRETLQTITSFAYLIITSFDSTQVK